MTTHMKARRTLYDLENHPALGTPCFTVLQLLDLDIVEVGKHDRTKPYKGLDTLYYTPQNYKKFKKEFDKEFEEYKEDVVKTPKNLISIHVPYKAIFGEPWTFDRVEYWGELPFVVFKGDNPKEWYDRSKWENHSGVSASGSTFEEMIVNLGRKFKRLYGSFDTIDFLTKKERANHSEEMALIDGKKHKGFTTMVSNPKYIHVGPSTLNLRWAKWFSETAYGKKNWPDLLDKKR